MYGQKNAKIFDSLDEGLNFYYFYSDWHETMVGSTDFGALTKE